MKIVWHYNKDEQDWYYSEDDGQNLWLIEGAWTFDLYPESRCGGYMVRFLHRQEAIKLWHPYPILSYGYPEPIFHCRYLKEAKAFVQMCINSRTMITRAYEYKNFPGKYGAEQMIG